MRESENDMKIRCEFCNTTYESKDHAQCPHCGAATGENKVVQEQLKRDQENRQKIEAHKLEQERLNTEQERIQSERARNQLEAERTQHAINKGIHIFKIIALCVVGLVLVIGIVSCSYSIFEEQGTFDRYEEEFEDAFGEKEEVLEIQETLQSVNLNEKATLTKYAVTCDKFESINPYPWKPAPNNEFFEAHFIVENLSDDTFEFEANVTCIADGYQCKEPIPPNAMGEELKYTHINQGLKTQGSLCFQVPTDAKEVIIKVGDYIEIKVR